MDSLSPEFWTATVALSHAEGIPPPSLQVLSKAILRELHISDAIREIPSEPGNSISYHFPVEAEDAQTACELAGSQVADILSTLHVIEAVNIDSVKATSDKEMETLIETSSIETLWMKHPEVVAYWLRTHGQSIRHTAEIMTKELTFHSGIKPPA